MRNFSHTVVRDGREGSFCWVIGIFISTLVAKWYVHIPFDASVSVHVDVDIPVLSALRQTGLCVDLG